MAVKSKLSSRQFSNSNNMKASQMKIRNWTLLGLVIVLAVGIFVALRPVATEISATVDTLRAGYLPHHGYLPLFVAWDHGYFSDENLIVTTNRFDSSPAMSTAFVNGDIDVLPIATSVALAIESRDPGKFLVFATSSESKTGYLTALVTMPTSGIKMVEDLRGKKVGCFPGPASLTLFGMVFQKHGLDPKKDLVLTELPPPLQIQALISGQVDALATYEPTATKAVEENGAVKFFPAAVETDVLDPTQGGLWIISSDIVRTRPETARRFNRAIYRAIDYIREHSADALISVTNFTSTSAAVAAKLPSIPYQKSGEIDANALQKHADIMTDHGVLSKRIEVQPLLLDTNSLPLD